jgi:threonylcarbamoyladenosine tRNA methylthiotransferase MtaB
MKNTPAVAFYTLGCKLNFAETSTIERLFVENGYRKADQDMPADVIVINTCTVTANAEKKCRNIINKAARNSPGAYIAVVGCYSQLSSDKVALIPGVDLVLGSEEKFKIFDLAGDFKKKNRAEVYSGDISDAEDFSPSYSVSGRTRSFLKIQDGCDYFCSYCTIPLARGRSRSARADDIVKQAREISAKGIREIVLTGVNIGDFGKPGNGLLELLCRLREETNIERYRISSVEPDLLSDGIINLVAENSIFAPHFHLPLQSGSDRILEKMKRKYRLSHFTDRVKKIKERIPGAGVGADLITGFPGESAGDFEDTVEFLSGSDIAYLHVFSYSDRQNTLANRLPDKIAPEEIDRRSKILHRISENKRKHFMDECSGQLHRVLFEAISKKGRMYGFTGNYIRVEVPGDKRFVNRLAGVKLLAAGEDGIMKGMITEY